MVGNCMIDSLVHILPSVEASEVAGQLGLVVGGYSVLTLHRPRNVDDQTRFEHIMNAVAPLASERPVVFPVHPRTRRWLTPSVVRYTGVRLPATGTSLSSAMIRYSGWTISRPPGPL